MFLLRKSPVLSIHSFIRLYSLARKNHYDVLRLRKNCSDKEIKEAFIQMSKEYHPDKNKDARAQEKFVQIVEAYNVLGKPISRAQYDNLTEISTSGGSYVYRAQYDTYNYRAHFYDTAANKNGNSWTEKEKRAPNEWYYGFAGVRKLPNYYIICICFSIAFIGVMLQVYVIRNMYAIQRTKAQEKSKRLAEELERVRSVGRDNGNELQTKLLLEKIVTAANPTATTASLGQALANEKKDQTDTLLTEFGIGEGPEWYDSKQSTKVNLCGLIREIMSYLC